VFLDEVGELAADARTMMLRFLQSGEGRPVEGVQTTRFDVRVIAATHRDLVAAVQEGTFRADLYFRLRHARLKVPPLRQRREDIRSWSSTSGAGSTRARGSRWPRKRGRVSRTTPGSVRGGYNIY
jgi:transcriptional regulator with GAF, ATPase, and Fis domain